MRRSIQTLVLLLAVAFAPACENTPPWGSGDGTDAAEAGHDFGPTAAYARRLIFLGPGGQLPTAALFDFTSLSDSLGVRRGVRARLLTGDAWEPLMDAGWEFEPMREPWRLVPGGDLKIVVNSGGELAAVAYRAEPEVRLEPGALIAESSPDAGTQFVLRQATLDVSGQSVRGILLDSQLGRAVDPGAVPRRVPADTSTGRPTPIARAGAEAFLVNNSGYYAVFATSAAGQVAWVSQAGRDDIHRGVVLEPAAWSTAGEEEIRMPLQWRVRAPGDAMAGELSAAATDPAPLTDLGELTALGYALVTGWIEESGVRRNVFGLVRHVR